MPFWCKVSLTGVDAQNPCQAILSEIRILQQVVSGVCTNASLPCVGRDIAQRYAGRRGSAITFNSNTCITHENLGRGGSIKAH